jgi:hypothetical protein
MKNADKIRQEQIELRITKALESVVLYEKQEYGVSHEEFLDLV